MEKKASGGGYRMKPNSSNYNKGITSPISFREPTQQDLDFSTKLVETLRPHGVFESQADAYKRIEVLRKFNMLVTQWIREITITKGMSESYADRIQGKVFTFGSYRLGVNSKDGDIDTLCVVPYHINREDFFSSFMELLRCQPEVKHLQGIEGAFVPVIKMKFDGIELDVLFAQLQYKSIPADLELRDDSILNNLHPKCILSLNGCRVTEEVLWSVPNQDSFRVALRAIKFWAQKTWDLLQCTRLPWWCIMGYPGCPDLSTLSKCST